MDARTVLAEAYRGSHEAVSEAMDDVRPEWLFDAPSPSGVTIGYLLWHLVRDEDTVVQQDVLAGTQLWSAEGWASRMGVDTEEQGTGFDIDDVARLRYDLADLRAYAERVWEATARFVESVDDERLQADIWGRSTLAHLLNGSIAHNWVHIGEVRALMGLQGWRDRE